MEMVDVSMLKQPGYKQCYIFPSISFTEHFCGIEKLRIFLCEITN